MLPPYSVLMSVYYKEQAGYLESSLASMRAQSYAPDEIVLVCDGALTPELERMIQIFNAQNPGLMRLVRLAKNVGLGEALNQGLLHCRNECIVRMDTDDIALPKRVEVQMTHMHEYDLDICGCDIIEFNDNDSVERVKSVPREHADILRYAKKRNPFNHPSVVFRKSTILVAGGYRTMPFFEDYFLWIRALQKGAHCGNVPEVLLRMRTGMDFYMRRGGAAYCRALSVFWNQAAAIGFVTRWEAFSRMMPRIVVAMLPGRMREQVYQNLLRA